MFAGNKVQDSWNLISIFVLKEEIKIEIKVCEKFWLKQQPAAAGGDISWESESVMFADK